MRRAFLAGGAMALLPAIAWAAEAEKQGGMPQLDFGNPLTISQVVWMGVIFLVLYMLVSFWALPQVDEVLAERARRIAGDLETARAAKAEADAAIAELTDATRRAHAEAQAAIAAALAEAKEAAAAEAQQFNERLDARLAAAEQQIAEARGAAMGALRQVAREAAEMLIRRLTSTTPDPQAVDTAVGSALAARRV